MSDGLTPGAASVPAGWYPDAAHPGQLRWWNGIAWTDAVQPVPPAPPVSPPPAAPFVTATSAAGSDPWSATVPLPPYAREDAIPTTVIPPYQGAPGAYAVAAPPTTGIGRNPLALWALILGIAGVLTLLVPFVGVVLGAVALVLGFLGVSRARRAGTRRGLAITGVVLGAVAAALGLILTLVLLVGAAMRTGTAIPEADAPVPVPSETVAPVEPPPPATPEDEPLPEQDGDPDFVSDSRNDLDDFAKDLDDMIVTLDEGGFWRLLGNSVELSFNYAQLASRLPPASIAEEWTAQLAVLEDQITRIDEAIADERNDDLRAVIAEAQAQVGVLNGVLDRAGG